MTIIIAINIRSYRSYGSGIWKREETGSQLTVKANVFIAYRTKDKELEITESNQ